MPEIAVAYSLSGQPLIDPRYLLKMANQSELPTNAWLNKANRFILPKGKNAGIGWVLMLQKDFSELGLDDLHFLNFKQSGKDKGELQLSDLVIVKADAVYAAGVITDEALYLVELADKRHLFFLSAINKDYNVLSPDGTNFFDDSLNSSAEWTWQEVLDDLWLSLPDTRAAIPGETTPQLSVDEDNDFLLSTNPQNLQFHGTSAWEAINHVLDRLNYAAVINFDGQLRYDPEWDEITDNGTFGAKGILDKAIQDHKALDVSLSQQGTIPRIPATVRVFFPSRESKDASGTDYTLQKAAVTVDTVSSTILTDVKTSPGTVLVIWDEMEAIFDNNGNITNQADLNTRGLEVATAHLESDPSQLSDSRLYMGLIQVIPGTFAAFVAWGDTRFGLTTETGNTIPDVIKDRVTPSLEGPMLNEAFDPIGDVLAAWTPNQLNDSPEPSDVGVSVTFTSDNHPTAFGNTVNRVPGFVNPFAWHLNNTTTFEFSSMLFVDAATDFLDVTKPFSQRIVFKMEDLTYTAAKYLFDHRDSFIIRVNDTGTEDLEILTWNGSSHDTHTPLTDAIEEDVWYVLYIRYVVGTLSVAIIKLEDEVELTRTNFPGFEDFSATIVAAANTNGIFFGDRADGTAVGMRGFVDAPWFYQKALAVEHFKSDFNRGRPRRLQVTNPFFDGEGKTLLVDHTGFKVTTNATVTNLIFIPIPDDSSVCVEAVVNAFRTDGANQASFKSMALFQRRAAGAATLIGSTLIGSVNDIGGPSGINAAVSGNLGIITVTGRAARVLNWHGRAFVLPAF